MEKSENEGNGGNSSTKINSIAEDGEKNLLAVL